MVLASKLFNEIVNKGEVDAKTREKMRDIEHEGDKIAYSIIDHLNKTFITPFDREDIHTLAKIGHSALVLNGILKTTAFIIISPILGFIISALFIIFSVNHLHLKLIIYSEKDN